MDAKRHNTHFKNLFAVDRHIHPSAARTLHMWVAHTIAGQSEHRSWRQRESYKFFVQLIGISAIDYIDREYPVFSNLDRQEIEQHLTAVMPAHGRSIIEPAVRGVGYRESVNPQKPGHELTLFFQPNEELKEEELVLKAALEAVTRVPLQTQGSHFVLMARTRRDRSEVRGTGTVRGVLNDGLEGLRIPLLPISFYNYDPPREGAA
ncbi:MAG TPA: hypothetical protein VJ836_05035 [Candidatus Saccharimonadales bacterium]|nr:hypothetical protein [Candidatus Saccharimonadales bacterium]